MAAVDKAHAYGCGAFAPCMRYEAERWHEGAISDGMDVDTTGIAREVPYERWKRQFGHGKALTERLTGRYVASMGDVGRVERTPAGWKLPGKERLTTTKADDFFASSLRGYEPSTPSSSSPARLSQSARSMRRQLQSGGGGGGRSEIRI